MRGRCVVLRSSDLASGGSAYRLSRKKKDSKIPKFQGWCIFFFAGVVHVTLTELTSSAVATYEANEATASVKFVTSVKI